MWGVYSRGVEKKGAFNRSITVGKEVSSNQSNHL